MMRDILNTLESLNESTGLANRKPGDVFRDSSGNELVFNGINFYPEGGGKFTPEELTQAIEQFGNSVQWLNTRSSRSGGFGIASFESPEGEVLYGRFLENIKPDLTGNYVPNQIGDYRFAGASAAKARAGLSPQDLLTDKIDLTADDILTQLAEKLGTDSPLYGIAVQIASGDPLPITIEAPENISFAAFRDYFCEILQPIALQMGQCTGDAEKAAKIFLDGTYEGTLISFDTSKTAGLSDSIMTASDGKYLKVSTKGGAGATASTSNLINSVNELSNTPAGRKLTEKYADTIEILREIQKKGQALAPIYLGLKYDIIDKDDATKIISFKNLKPVPFSDVDKLGLSENLMKLAMLRKPTKRDSVNFYFHLLAAVAYRAAEEVNEHTDFSKAAADILNNGALLQVYTNAKESKGQWTLNSFKGVYPDEGIKGVYLSASKTYYSTGIKGNFTFKIDRGSGKPDEDADTETAAEPDEKEFTKKASDIALGRSKRKADPMNSKTKMGDVGRQKRK